MTLDLGLVSYKLGSLKIFELFATGLLGSAGLCFLRPQHILINKIYIIKLSTAKTDNLNMKSK